MSKAIEERIAGVEVEVKYHDSFFKELNREFKGRRESISELTEELRKEREMAMKEIDINIEKKMKKLGWIIFVAEYPKVALFVFTIYTILLFGNTREIIFSSII